MITVDPARRTAVVEEVKRAVAPGLPAPDRELIAALVPIVLGEWPDHVALRLPIPALAARLRDHFAFVVGTMPPADQLYKGLPGLHVSVRNPTEEETAAFGGSPGGSDVTLIQTHTLDAPFILESLKNYCRKSGLRVLSAFGAVFTARRRWERIVWMGGPQEEGSLEAYCCLEVEPVDSHETLRRMQHEIHAVLKCVLTAVEGFPEIVRVMRDLMPRLHGRGGLTADVDAAREFVEWLLRENFIFFGTVRYRVGPDGVAARAQETATGVFTDPALLPVVFPGVMEEVEASILPAADDARIVDLDYCHNAQAIYHFEPIDDIVLREWGPDGTFLGATLVLGRFSQGALAIRPGDIPLLKEKQAWLLAHSGDVVDSHVYREIRALFNRFPKRELLYSDVVSLKELIDKIVFMTSDDEVAVHVRRGIGYVSVSVAFSRLRYSYETEERLRQALAAEYGKVSFSGSTDCGSVMLFVFYFDSSLLERQIEEGAVLELARPWLVTWEDRAAGELVARLGERAGRALLRRHREGLSGLYHEATPPEEVPEDLLQLDGLASRLEVRVLPRHAEGVLLKVFSQRPLSLSEIIRTLQNLGLTVTEELRVPLQLPDGRRAFVYRFEVESRPERIAALLLASGEARFRRALQAIDEGRATDGPLNALVLQVGLDWREVDVLRALRNHLLQTQSRYNVETVTSVLLRNSSVAYALFQAFAVRFDPELSDDRAPAVSAGDQSVEVALRGVEGLTEDEILRALHGMIRAAVRTNFYQRPERPVVAIKVDSGRVEVMPSPRPMFEIYVHSRLLEGIHLRGGKVARGGIRWSDRPDDFRTEILGLMKTQMVKNSVIVPVGSKGGFVLKGVLPVKPAIDAYLVDRYREFVSGLLDVTDNIVAGEVLHPPQVVRWDEDDPYLVVAADKGTAHLSDTANSVANQYGFWLGDAFASGGRHGYDHKKVGITARGVWECVKHHFGNLGVDVQREPVTVAGVGDLAGDVFGNGMLQSRALKVVAAFNHAHVFIDPDPDPEASYRERERVFRLPRSTWRDYDPARISGGGGVFDRSAKSIPVSAEMRRLLDLEGATVTGEELVRRVLKARVDLLYNGGIGTYVKASHEEHADVGDRANDRVRVNGRELRARVVAEGGNLGLTQRGRLEFWESGGVINTDAVDNSGGVDMSDHEVNLKILMDVLVKNGQVASREERNRILAELTESVAELVLADNSHQALALSLDGLRTARGPDAAVALVEDLAAMRIVDRVDDVIPAREELLAMVRLGRGLPRPLLAVLLGQVKRWARERVLASAFPDSDLGRPFLEAYFPEKLRATFRESLGLHVLRREIIATAVVNHLVNCAGIALLPGLGGRGDVGGVVEHYLRAEHEGGVGSLREAARTGRRDAAGGQALLLEIEDVLAEAVKRRVAGEAFDLKKKLKAIRSRP
jgi:glutamate dehydrogenase